MIDESSAIFKFSERVTLWLPGAFSVVVLVFAGIPPALFLLTGRALVETPAHYSMLFVGLLGVTVNGVLFQQQRRIRALESALRDKARPSTI